jgi:hypothetical protein
VRRPRLLPSLFGLSLAVGCLSWLLAGTASGQEVTTPTTAPATTAPAPTTTEPPATTEAPPTTAAATTAPAPTAKPKPTTTTIPPTTTTPDQLPTLPPLPADQVPAATETTVAKPPPANAARISPLFPALSIGGFTVALLILVVQFLLSGRRIGR